MKIKSVCIVGGGSSGWMTAALLCKNLPNLKIIVVEPKNIPTVGVGESTLGHINRYLDCIGLLGKDAEWMPQCNAPIKFPFNSQTSRIKDIVSSILLVR